MGSYWIIRLTLIPVLYFSVEKFPMGHCRGGFHYGSAIEPIQKALNRCAGVLGWS